MNFSYGVSHPLLQSNNWGRPPKLSLTKARIHPFQADIEYLNKVITYFNPDDETAHFIGMETRHDNTVLLLPSFLRYPQASPDLIRDEDIENDEETVALFPWTVNGISIRPEDCVSLLTSLSGAWAGTDGATVGSDMWNLQYFLQASDDPSLLVPAQKVWTESDDTLEFLNRKFGKMQTKRSFYPRSESFCRYRSKFTLEINRYGNKKV
ncbi:hypothetical protein C5S42_06650 [Candidatus Methanomarinus sp.]|nr:hypothetical protein C5S42_06650 [ANME-2 cluster archaeon]